MSGPEKEHSTQQGAKGKGGEPERQGIFRFAPLLSRALLRPLLTVGLALDHEETCLAAARCDVDDGGI